MVDDVKDITEKAESKVSAEALDRARLARERREAEQRKRLDELRAHAAAAQAQREKRDEERRRRQAEQRAKDDDRRVQVEERKRAIWEASVSRREALVQRERDRAERVERARAARSAPRPAFAFGSSTPRLLEPVDSAGFFWAARSTNPIDQMNFFESLAASTTNVMFASAPLTRRASALHLDISDTDAKDEADRSAQAAAWSSVARRRTDLVPTLPAPRAPETRSGETTPGSRPGSALAGAPVPRRASSAPRRPRPASIAGTGVNTPRGADTGASSAVTTPSVSRDATTVLRPATTPRRPRPLSLHAASSKPATPLAPGDGKPPPHRKPKPSKDHDRSGRGKSLSASPGRTLSPSPAHSKEPSVDKEITKHAITMVTDKSRVSAAEVTQKLEALQISDGRRSHDHRALEVEQNNVEVKQETNCDEKTERNPNEKVNEVQKPVEKIVVQKPLEKEEDKKVEKAEEKRDERKESSQEKTEENEMTASMMARRITTEEEAKAALAERRRRAREELERQAELERQRLQQEAEEEAERQRQEEERQRREEEEARELAALQRRLEEEKLRKAIEAQQQLEREEAARKAREEEERAARAREDEARRRAADDAERARREEAVREERERLARKQRVEAIMARTRLKKQAEEDKKQQELKAQQEQTTGASGATPETAQPSAAPDTQAAPAAAPLSDNGNVRTDDLLPLSISQPEDQKSIQVSTEPNVALEPSRDPSISPNNGNVTADLLGLSEQTETKDKIDEQTTTKQNDNANSTSIVETNNAPTPETNYTPMLETNNANGNVHTNSGHISANFIQSERMSAEHSQKLADVPKLIEDDFTTHNGHGTLNHPLTLQNAI